MSLLRLFVRRSTAAPLAILVELELVGRGALVLIRVVVSPFALFALERHQNSISAGHFSVLEPVMQLLEYLHDSGISSYVAELITRAHVQD